MLRIIRHAFLVAFALALALLAVALARPQWLVPVLADLLPAGWQFDDLTVVARAPRLPKVQRLVLSVAGCRLLDAEDVGATLVWRGLIPALDTVRVGTLAIDPACLPAGAGEGVTALEPPEWASGLIPGARLQIGALSVAGWLAQPHRLAVQVDADAFVADVDGPLVRVAGRWQRGGGIAVTELGGARGQLATAAVTATNPRVELLGPAHLDPATRRVTATLRVLAERLNLTAGGRLEGPAIVVHLDGPIDDLRWTAEGEAEGVGPVQAEGTWSDGALRARLRLTRQALSGLQPLLPPTLPVELEAGAVGGEATLTWAAGAPGAIRLEGEVDVSDGRLQSTHAVAEGVALRLPFSLADGVWRLGGKRAGQVSARRVVAAVDVEAVSARIAGSWPASVGSPLRIDGLTLRALGGEARLDRLELPQRGGAATLRLRGVQLEQVSALYGGAAVSLSGTVDADLPLRLGDSIRLIEGGQVRNATGLRLRLNDAEALEAFKSTNPALAQAADWLAELEIDRLEGTVDLARDGALVLVATIEGRNPTQGERPVQLNYRHEENLLHLLQSLRVGSDLSRSIEERLSPRSRSGR